MRTLFLLLTAFAAFAVNAQTTVIEKDITKSVYYVAFERNDVINGSTVDTIQFNIFLNKDMPVEVYTKTDWDLIGTADTTITVILKGKILEDESWDSITSTTFASSANGSTILSYYGSALDARTYTIAGATDLIAAVTTTNSDTVTVAARTITEAITAIQKRKYYRYIQLEYIIAGNDATGSGVYLDKLHIKIYE